MTSVKKGFESLLQVKDESNQTKLSFHFIPISLKATKSTHSKKSMLDYNTVFEMVGGGEVGGGKQSERKWFGD